MTVQDVAGGSIPDYDITISILVNRLAQTRQVEKLEYLVFGARFRNNIESTRPGRIWHKSNGANKNNFMPICNQAFRRIGTGLEHNCPLLRPSQFTTFTTFASGIARIAAFSTLTFFCSFPISISRSMDMSSIADYKLPSIIEDIKPRFRIVNTSFLGD
jgi:hypothetical protein